MTRRRGRPRFEATNEQRRAVAIWSGWGSRRRISAVSCGTAGIGRSAKTRCENILNRRSRGGPQKVNALMGLFIVKTILGKAAASRHLANHRPQCQRRLTELFARAHMGWPTMAAPGRQAVAARHLSGQQRLTRACNGKRLSTAIPRAVLALDHDFAALMHTDSYHIFLTPYGDSNGLFVAHIRPHGFTVREQQGGEHSLEFAYRVVARRRDVTVTRLEPFQMPVPPVAPTRPPQPQDHQPRTPRMPREV